MVKKVLVADDDALLCELIEHKFSSSGHDVSIAEDGKQALEAAALLKPDVIVLDAMMPHCEGFEVLRHLKNDPELRSIPVVMLSARKRGEDIVGALKLGAADYITKPFMPEELLARVDRLIAAGQA